MYTALLSSIRISLYFMNTLTYILIIALSIWIGMGNCSKKEKAEKSEDALAELFLELAQATQQCTADTAALRQRQEAILQAHHISPREVEQTLRDYRQHPEKWIQLLQKMNEKQEKQEKKGKKKAAQ